MKSKKKIAFVTPIYLPANLSGSGVMVRQLAEAFAKEGADVSVVTSNALTGRYWYDPIFGKKNKIESEIINGVKVYRLLCNQVISSFCFVLVKYCNFLLPKKILNKLQLIYNGPYLIGLENIFQKEHFDVIHCSPFPLNINRQVPKSIKKLQLKSNLIFTPFFHSEVSDFKNSELKKVLNAANKIHVVTQAEKFELQKIFDIPDDKIVQIPLFLDVKKMTPFYKLRKEISDFKKKYNLENRKIILFAGNKGYMKGAIHLLTVVNELYKKDPSYILMAIGNALPEWKNAKKYIDERCLLDFGYKQGKEKEIIFGACDVFCMPSISESFGLVYLEAWHKKKPVIGADIPPVKELIGDAGGGLLIKYEDEEELEKVIKKLFSDKKLAKKLGENGYKALMSRYTFQKVCQHYINLFN